jgi:hypothetical protein
MQVDFISAEPWCALPAFTNEFLSNNDFDSIKDRREFKQFVERFGSEASPFAL